MAEVGPLGIPAEFFDVLACPCPEHAPLTVDDAAGQLVCTACGTRFDVRDGVPVMLLSAPGPTPGG